MAESVVRRGGFAGLAALLAVLCVLGASRADAVCELRGDVRHDGGPFQGAVVVMTRQDAEIARAETGADGSFTLAYPPFPTRVRAAKVLVSAERFATDARLYFRRGDDPCLETADVRVEIDPEEDTPDDFSRLGNTIFVARFAIFGESAETIAERINADLPQIVHHRILAYQSLLEVPTSQLDISVDTTSESVRSSQGERIRRLGHRLNALAVIAGDGDLVTGADGEKEVELVSVFRTIPFYKGEGALMQPIRDRIPVRRANPSRIAESLQALWGKQAILSYVLQRLAANASPWKPEELADLEGLLVAAHRTMDDDDELLEPLEALLAVVRDEVGP